MYICYNAFFGENSYRDEDDCPEYPYYEALMRQMPPLPPVGQPSGMPDSTPPGAPFGSDASGKPGGAPPSFTPVKTHTQPKAISGGAMNPCKFRYVYIWLDNGRSFWAWLVYVDRRSASGYRWNGRNWVYFGIDLKRIESFVCY